jgi:hypothetical protein
MKWFARERISFIQWHLDRCGFINRGHIVNKFEVSTQQASMDLRTYMRLYPNAIYYDKSTRRYRKSA